MRYVAAYVVYALSVAAVLIHLVPPQAPVEQPAQVPATEDRLALYVVDDYFAQGCTTRVSALAADIVLFTSQEEFEEARKSLGC